MATYPEQRQSCHLERLPFGSQYPTGAFSSLHVREVKPGVWVTFMISPVYKICRVLHKIETPLSWGGVEGALMLESYTRNLYEL